MKCLPAAPTAEPPASERGTVLCSCHPMYVHYSNVCRETHSESRCFGKTTRHRLKARLEILKLLQYLLTPLIYKGK